MFPVRVAARVNLKVRILWIEAADCQTHISSRSTPTSPCEPVDASKSKAARATKANVPRKPIISKQRPMLLPPPPPPLWREREGGSLSISAHLDRDRLVVHLGESDRRSSRVAVVTDRV